MILDVNSPLANGYLDRTAPWTTYTNAYYQQVFGVIEAFKSFDNVLGFFAGNEVINEDATRLAPLYVRAVIRDMKDYIAKQCDRAIPVGYSAADIRDILMDTVHYFECDVKNSTTSRADFFGLNSYSWCGDASYKSSGYDVLTEDFSNATLPVFFSEYGCNEVKPRIFTEVQALYGDEMTQAFSGGLVYEFTQEDNEYGLVQVNDNGTITTLIDYDNLMKQFGKLDMKRISASNSPTPLPRSRTTSRTVCPTSPPAPWSRSLPPRSPRRCTTTPARRLPASSLMFWPMTSPTLPPPRLVPLVPLLPPLPPVPPPTPTPLPS